MRRRSSKLSQTDKAVLAVLSYSAQFDHPLTVKEVAERLLTAKGVRSVDSGFKRSVKWPKGSAALQRRVSETLKSLAKKGVVLEENGLFTLAGKERALKKRAAFKKVQRQKDRLVDEFVKLVRSVPWVRGAVLTGSYAVGGAGEQDDVDLLIITQKNRLWLTRLWLLFQAFVRGRRPHVPGGDISQSWDLNFWLDETRLALPAAKQTLYEAYEVLQTRWVYEQHNTQQKFHAANPWVGEYLHVWQTSSADQSADNTRGIDWLNGLDWLAFCLQIGYRQLRHGKQRADKHSAFFHPASTRQNILTNWKKLYRSVVS